jgi:hypothetical protein
MHEAQQYGRDFSWASIAQQTREVYALALEIAGHHDVH